MKEVYLNNLPDPFVVIPESWLSPNCLCSGLETPDDEPEPSELIDSHRESDNAPKIYRMGIVFHLRYKKKNKILLKMLMIPEATLPAFKWL